jgi:hypothetical protein
MPTLDNADLQFLARLNRSPEGSYLLTVLRARLADRDATLRKARGEDVFRAQGRADELADLIGDITKAQDQLTRNQPALRRPGWEANSAPA